MLVSWGSGMYALPMYLVMGLFSVLGASVWSLRVVNLVFGLLSIAVFYQLAGRTKDRSLAIIAAFLLAIAPWHIMLSRWALDSNLFPAIFLLAVWFLVRGLERERLLVLSAFFLALSLYTYGTAYFVVPVFMLFVAVYLWSTHRLPAQRTCLIAAGVFSVMALPVLLHLAMNAWHWPSIVTPVFSIPSLPGPPRYYAVSSLFGGQAVSRLQENVATLGRLLLTGDDGLLWNVIPGFGYLYQFGCIFALIGLGAFFLSPRKRKDPVFVVMFLWLCAALILGAFESVNINRINIIFLPIIFFAAAGVRSLACSRVALVGALAYFVISGVAFTQTYFGSYRDRSAGVFFSSFGEAVAFASESTSGQICITDRVNQPYIFVLFFVGINPHEFLDSVVYENPTGAFRNVLSFGRYRFGLDRCTGEDFAAYVLTPKELSQLPKEELLFEIHDFERFVVALKKTRHSQLPVP